MFVDPGGGNGFTFSVEPGRQRLAGDIAVHASIVAHSGRIVPAGRNHVEPSARFLAMDGPGDEVKVERASSALADVDINGWTQRFDLLSDPNRLEILLGLHRAPGICVGDLAARARQIGKCCLPSTPGVAPAGLGDLDAGWAGW